MQTDLHLLSTHSGGDLSPVQLAATCRLLGLEAFSVTDLDTWSHNDGLAAAGLPPSPLWIPGVAVRARPTDTGHPIHILGYALTPDPAFRTLLDHAMARDLPDPTEVIRAIHTCGGHAAWAHPALDLPLIDAIEHHLAPLVAAGLEAIETLHLGHAPEDADRLAELATRHGLRTTAGSGFLGMDRPGRDKILIDCDQDLTWLLD